MLGLTSWASAQDVVTCTRIQDNNMRLACFDNLFSPQQDMQSKAVDLQQSYAQTVKSDTTQVVFAELPRKQGDSYTSLDDLYDLEENRPGGVLTVREHEPMYLLPMWYRSSPNYTPYTSTRGNAYDDVQQQQKRLEAKMQVSFKTKLVEDLFRTRADLWFGYTQQSNWQVYNQGTKSAPFRNNDYSPELFLTQPVKADLPWGGQLRMLGVGYLHQSNGQSRPLSRSWNRVYAMAAMQWGDLTVIPRVWMRVDAKGEKDDNPDITHYMGYGDFRLNYKYSEKHTIMSTLRYNPVKNKGAIQIGYTFPIKGKLKAYVQGFYGYGESLLDYNHKQKGIGIGVMLNDWNGL